VRCSRAEGAPNWALPLLPYTTQRRDESLELLTWLDTHVQSLEARIAEAAAADSRARQLMTHPGVGALTALATVLILGPVDRFPTSKHVVSYIGLAPSVNASADKYRLGHVTKQGNALLRFVLGQAGHVAVGSDADLKRLYCAVLYRHGRAKAKVAVARKLLVRFYIMLRDQIDYTEFRRRGQLRRLLHPRGEDLVEA
jgi:transposase